VRKELVGNINHIQQVCWPENKAYTTEDVNNVGFVNDRDMMECLISIRLGRIGSTRSRQDYFSSSRGYAATHNRSGDTNYWKTEVQARRMEGCYPAETESTVATLHEEVRAGRMDIGEEIESVMGMRDRTMINFCSEKKSPKMNRCHEQIIAFREIAQAKEALAAVPASNRIAVSQDECLRIADISDGRELSRSWIIDRETGAVELSGVWDATERSKGRADPRRQADDVECPFGTELLALTVGPVHT
jgi:hypothetical protein